MILIQTMGGKFAFVQLDSIESIEAQAIRGTESSLGPLFPKKGMWIVRLSSGGIYCVSPETARLLLGELEDGSGLVRQFDDVVQHSKEKEAQ